MIPAEGLSLQGVTVAYGAVTALNDVTLTIRPGEVHALMGENGAGKSTMIRVLAGLERPEAGSLHSGGREIPPGQPAAATAAGLRFVHQELHVVRWLSVAENMHLDSAYPSRFGLVDWRRLAGAARVALCRLGLDRIDPRAPITDLGPGDQMLVRIAARLLGEGAGLYVMDEPTAALSPAEAERLFDVIAELKAQGAGILYVSHRMDEVMRLADRVSVLRDGRLVSSTPAGETSAARIIEEMTGRALDGLYPPRGGATGAPILAAELGAGSLEVSPGEVLGIGGLAGSGRGALLRELIGAIPRSGPVTLDGSALGPGPRQAWARGLAYVPRERRSEGLMLARPLRETVVLPHLGPLARARLFLDRRRQRRLTEDLGREVRLKATSTEQDAGALSGGNQQKILFARALAGRPRVLLLDEPTRGVDIGARADLYRLIRDFTGRGGAVVMTSSDLPELIGLSDRIAILRDGRLAETIDAEGLSEAALLTRYYHDRTAEAA